MSAQKVYKCTVWFTERACHIDDKTIRTNALLHMIIIKFRNNFFYNKKYEYKNQMFNLLGIKPKKHLF